MSTLNSMPSDIILNVSVLLRDFMLTVGMQNVDLLTVAMAKVVAPGREL
jgi:hypothetical protein